MDREDRIVETVSQIYATVGNPLRWEECLTSICELLGSTGANLLYRDEARHGATIAAAARTDPAALALYTAHFHTADPWGAHVWHATIPAGKVLLGQALISHEKLRRTEYYADLGSRYGLTRSLIGIIEAPGHRLNAVITVNRPDSSDEFDADSARILGVLVPHLQRALALHGQLATIDAVRASLVDVIDRLRSGLILADARGQPVLVNRAANRVLSERDGLVLDGVVLRAGSSALTAALHKLIVCAAGVTEGRSAEARDGAIRLPRPSGRPPLQVVVTPIPRKDKDRAVEAAAAIFITAPDRVPLPTEGALGRRYAFTATEARVAAALASGQRLEDIAAAFHLTRDATRWYLKQVLRKADVHTQAQLIRMVLGNSDLAR